MRCNNNTFGTCHLVLEISNNNRIPYDICIVISYLNLFRVTVINSQSEQYVFTYYIDTYIKAILYKIAFEFLHSTSVSSYHRSKSRSSKLQLSGHCQFIYIFYDFPIAFAISDCTLMIP